MMSDDYADQQALNALLVTIIPPCHPPAWRWATDPASTAWAAGEETPMATLTLDALSRDDLRMQIAMLRHLCHPTWLAPNPEPLEPSLRSLRRWVDRLETELARQEKDTP